MTGPGRKKPVRTAVRLEDALEVEAFVGTVKKLVGEGHTALKYPQQPGSSFFQCACCGERAETAVFVRHSQLREHQMHLTIHTFPSCQRCKKHQEAYREDSWGCLLGIGLAVVMLLLMAFAWVHDDRYALLYLVPILIVVELACLRITGEEMKEHDIEIGPLLAKNCSDAVFVGFKREIKGYFRQTPVDSFWFTNREYAVRSSALNSGILNSD